MLPIYGTFNFSSPLDIAKSGLKGLLFLLLIGLVTTPAMAILSENAGQIQGQAPFVTGNVQVVFPDGERALTDNAMLGLDQIPNQFRVSSSTAGLVLQDADGDTGLAALVDSDHATLSWKYDGTALTTAQLAAPLGINFSGKTLTLDVGAPVTASSTTGLPTTAEPRLLTSSYTLTVASEFTTVSVNGHTFGMADGFPSTGFTGATFTLNMSGAASDYVWASTASWSSVDSNGQVTFTTQGNSSPVTITATPKRGGTSLTYTFSVNTWFINNGTEQMSWDQASTWCSNQQPMHKLPSTVAVTLGSRLRGGGSLWSEWGDMSKYSGSGFNGTYYSTAEVSGNSTYWVNLRDGSSGTSVNATTYVICQPGISDAVNIDKSLLAVSPASIVANGTATSQLTFTARDAINNPLTGRTVTFTTSGTGATGVKLGSVTESNGAYTATLTAGTTAGSVNVAVQVDGTTVSGTNNSKVVTLTPPPVDGTRSQLSVSPTSIIANGTATSQLTFTARDANNNPLTGRTVTFTTSGTGATGVKLGSVTESNGAYTATLTAGTTAGSVNVAVQVDGTTVSGTNNSKTITLSAVANITGVVVNGKSSTVDVGVPDVGFPNAPFQIQINGGTTANSSYTWTAIPATAASVSSGGEVKLLSGASSTTGQITIRATPNAGGNALEYTFKLNSWFEPVTGSFDYNSARTQCSGRGLVLPSINALYHQWSVWGDSRGLGMPSTQWSLGIPGNTSQPSMNTVDGSTTNRNASGGAYAGVSCWKEL